MILQANGQKYPTQTMTAKAVIFVSDDGSMWNPMKPEEIPDYINDPGIINCLMHGEVIEVENRFYIAEKMDDSRIFDA